ncbi:MAG: thioredoxin domain-containing protein [Patescibacteria group bacterium]|nr:thioredoxin domain-containing protein [Patescibacteria group bacterium]
MKKFFFIIFLLTLLLFIIVIVIIGVKSFKIYKNPIDSTSSSKYTVSTEKLKLINNNPLSHSIGSSSPLITIVEFSDFTCPYCKNAFSTIREISLKYQDKIRIIYRHYPIITEYSTLLALSAECAGEQDKFWAMHDSLFLNQGISTANELNELARQIGLDGKKFNNCLEGKKYLGSVTADLKAGQNLGITGTPTWYINDIKIAGNIPPNIFSEIINGLLIQNNKNNNK